MDAQGNPTHVQTCNTCGDFLEVDPATMEYLEEPCGFEDCPCLDTDMVVRINLDEPDMPSELDFNEED